MRGGSAVCRRCLATRASSAAVRPRKGLLTLLRGVDMEVYLVGTAHIGEESRTRVREVIRTVKPSVVMVELCSDRARAMEQGGSMDVPSTPGDLSFARFAFAPGGDMKTAMEEARALNARIVHGDFKQSDTLSKLKDVVHRGGGLMTLFGRLTSIEPPPSLLEAMSPDMLLRGGLESLVERLKNRERLAEFKTHLDKAVPDIMEIMLHRRDKKLFDSLLSREVTNSGSTKIAVAVVGLAHMDGIERHWEDIFGAASVQHFEK